MNPVLIGGAALVAGLAWLMGKKKEGKAPSTAEVSVEPEGGPITGRVVVPSSVLSPTAARPVAVAPTSASPAAPYDPYKTVDPFAPIVAPLPATATTSPGWPQVAVEPPEPPGTGTTSGATSVTSTGDKDDAFDQLLAAAIAKGDIAQLIALAQQAELRGLTDVAESIRAEIARLTASPPIATPPAPLQPVAAPVSTPLGRATISMAAGSRGADVKEWQRIVGVTQDGIFGPITDKATRAWQKARPPLVVDGIVGPKTWTAAYNNVPALAVAPRVETTITAPVTTTSTTRPTIKQGSTGAAVKEWQGIIAVKADGIFGPITDAATRAWQKARPPLVVDGIVGPLTWGAAFTGIPAPVMVMPTMTVTATPPPAPTMVADAPVESDARKAASELTSYLESNGGLAGRWTVNTTKIAGYQGRLGLVADGLYGRNSAKAVILQGFVPVVPFRWPKTGAAQAKAEFTAFVKQYADTDPARAAQWNKLLADIVKS